MVWKSLEYLQIHDPYMFQNCISRHANGESCYFYRLQVCWGLLIPRKNQIKFSSAFRKLFALCSWSCAMRIQYSIGRSFSTFLMPRPFNTVPHVVVTSQTIKLCILLLHNYNFATVMNHNVNIWYVWYLICNHQRDRDPQVQSHSARCILK